MAFSSSSSPSSFTLASIQLGSIGNDKAQNLQRARSKISEAARALRPDLVVLPEIFNSPYGPTYFDSYAEVIGWHEAQDKNNWDVEHCPSETIRSLSQIARQENVWLFGGSIPERSPNQTNLLYNSAPVFSPQGNLVALHRKLHLFDINVPNGITFKESLTLSPGQSPLTIVDTPFGKIGLGICYDMRFPEMAMIAASKGCIAMIYPGAFNLTTGPLHWELLQRARALDNQIYVITCSPARNPSSDYQAWGHSTIVDPMARIVATTDEKESIVFGSVDLDLIFQTRASIPVLNQKRYDVYPEIGKLVHI